MFHKNIKRANKWLHKTFSRHNVNGAASYFHKKLDGVKESYNHLKEGLMDTETGRKLVQAVESNPLAEGVSLLYAGAHDLSKGVEDGTATKQRSTKAVNSFIEN